MKKNFFILVLFLFIPIHATEYDCTELYGDYRIVFKGTKDEARQVSKKHYISRDYCYQDLNNFLNNKKVPIEYDCIELYGDYRIVFKGTKDEARQVSKKHYISRDYCYQDLNNFLNNKKVPIEYDCIELYGDYRIVFKGTKDEARQVSKKHYISRDYCYQDLNNFLNNKKAPIEYDCIELYGDYRIVFKGTKDEARQVSKKHYISRDYCYQDLKDYLAKQK